MFATGLDVPAARAVTKGAAYYLVLFAGIIYHMQTLVPLQQPPLPAAVVFALIALWATYVGWIQKTTRQPLLTVLAKVHLSMPRAAPLRSPFATQRP